MQPVNLFCLPFAGGNQYSFRELRSVLPASVNLIPLDYPGRGARMRESMVDSIEGMMTDAFDFMKPRLDKPYAVYGHSMGAAIAFELLHRINKDGLPMPLHLFVSGRPAPSSPRKREKISHLPSPMFRSKIKELGGSPDEVLNNEALMELFEPILRNDFHAHENYEYRHTEKLSIPLTAMYGDGEDFPDEDVEAWSTETSARSRIIRFEGDHFFIFRYWKDIAGIITTELCTQ
jgi:surfactin synthase thioesterase subunit